MNSRSERFTRRDFLRTSSLTLLGVACAPVLWATVPEAAQVMTVTGPIPPKELGTTLIHEHVLVDFIGATQTGYERWDRAAVVTKVLPYLEELKARGCRTLLECTPAYLGRDPRLLRELAERSGLHLLTNTGYYGASDNKYLPPHAFTESADQLAARWIGEWERGIEATGIRPGFLKTSVSPGPLSPLHEKLIRAAARTHRQTGLTIVSHTGPGEPAFQQLTILREEGVDPSAFVWTHAQNEPDGAQHVAAARQGAWVSLDGVADDNVADYVARLAVLKKAGVLHRVLLSHDAGWYRPGEPDGGEFRPYTAIFDRLLPLLTQQGFRSADRRQLLERNPAEAYAVQKRLLR
ncbi:phosphotriesterase-related protein [Catalinimonas alkaloidigena]|uniref:Phosphotriesterase-related protein n=1 Tax=Catalinimonas alkaloidigena TaxID=1075417 RepID=A0A1G9A043_9BACT|nr:aryldialkylphosphatase [Catalinimonas alkaloidigena]SDK20749.1 phosphotriesterase-related protein [Catalinimonas alkaloidigena]